MHQTVIVKCLLLGQLLAVGSPGASALEDETDKDCSLIFRVRGADGSAGGMVLAELVDSTGNVVMKTFTKDGVGRICDADFGVYSLRVGPGWCIPTVLTNIRLLPGHPLDLTVTGNSCGNRPDHGNGCRVYARISGSDGKPVPGAEVTSGRLQKTADRYGRVLFLQGDGTTIVVKFSAEGYEPIEIPLECKFLENIERKVVLRKLP